MKTSNAAPHKVPIKAEPEERFLNRHGDIKVWRGGDLSKEPEIIPFVAQDGDTSGFQAHPGAIKKS